VRHGAEQAVALSHNNVASAGMIAPHPTEVRIRVRHSFTEVIVRVRVRHSKLMAKHCRARLVNKESQTSDVSATKQALLP
jgi:hypothetical protein